MSILFFYIYTMLIYKLYGIISDIDEKKIIIGGHIDTYLKMQKVNGRGPLLDGCKISIFTSSSVDNTLLGKKVIVRAYIRRYSFKSTFTYNLNDVITGWNLHVVDIEQNSNWV